MKIATSSSDMPRIILSRYHHVALQSISPFLPSREHYLFVYAIYATHQNKLQGLDQEIDRFTSSGRSLSSVIFLHKFIHLFVTLTEVDIYVSTHHFSRWASLNLCPPSFRTYTTLTPIQRWDSLESVELVSILFPGSQCCILCRSEGSSDYKKWFCKCGGERSVITRLVSN